MSARSQPARNVRHREYAASTTSLRERPPEMEARIRIPWGGCLHRKAALSQTEALERKVAELKRFCSKLALENEILKKGL